MAEHRSKNTLGRSVPVKIVTDVEDGRTSEGGSPRCLGDVLDSVSLLPFEVTTFGRFHSLTEILI